MKPLSGLTWWRLCNISTTRMGTSKPVPNRVAEIHKTTFPEWWHHVPGYMNPADDSSWGVCIQHFQSGCQWWSVFFGSQSISGPMLQWTAFQVAIKKLNYPFNVVILMVLLKKQLNQVQAKPKSQRNKEIKRRNAMTSWHRKQIRYMHKCAIRPCVWWTKLVLF